VEIITHLNLMSRCFVPDATPLPSALARTTHLAIGAHPDDLEFMAYHGIATCFEESDRWFTGVTCCDGAGSVQQEKKSDDLVATRHAEQLQAARLGKYGAIFQLGYSSETVKEKPSPTLTTELVEILLQCQPEVLYAHNPADSHPTHLAVLAATVAAVRQLPKDRQPDKFFGCEVWRDLDWLPTRHKIALDVSDRLKLARGLNNCFRSQMIGGKNYAKAVEGRRRAHATFYDSHSADEASHLSYALDLMPLLHDENRTLSDYMEKILQEFQEEVLSVLS
jgi:LmbE family N-acetylglucosaminyl deacetylase